VKPTRTLSLLFAGCLLAFLSSPVLAQGTADQPSEPNASIVLSQAPSACLTLAGVIGDPIPLSTCFISVACDGGGSVSCSGDISCTTSGPNNRCVTCDGVQQGCCERTCCEVCWDKLENCLANCGPFGFPPNCNACDTLYDFCVEYTCGGC